MTRRRDFLGLVSIWLIVTAYNLFKPFHIDDTAHLIISAWILHHPLHPLRGQLNWLGTAQPIYQTNQPPLYFYLLAIWEFLFGFSEPALHSLQALFAAACIVLFHRRARQLAPAHALWLTAPFTAVGIGRFLLLVSGRSARGATAESPTQEMLRDVPFILNLVAWAAVVVVIVYRLRPAG